MSRRGQLLFAVAVMFATWNIYENGLDVRSGAIAALIALCLVINLYNGKQKRKMEQELEKEQAQRHRSKGKKRRKK